MFGHFKSNHRCQWSKNFPTPIFCHLSEGVGSGAIANRVICRYRSNIYLLLYIGTGAISINCCTQIQEQQLPMVICRYRSNSYLWLYVGTGAIAIYCCMQVQEQQLPMVICRYRSNSYLLLYVGTGAIATYGYMQVQEQQLSIVVCRYRSNSYLWLYVGTGAIAIYCYMQVQEQQLPMFICRHRNNSYLWWLGNFAQVVRLPSGNRAECFLSGEPVPRQTSVGLLPVFEGDVPDVQLAVSQNGVPAA